MKNKTHFMGYLNFKSNAVLSYLLFGTSLWPVICQNLFINDTILLLMTELMKNSIQMNNSRKLLTILRKIFYENLFEIQRINDFFRQ